MKFSCEKYLLQNAVSIASRAAASKSPIPALEGLLLQAMGDLRVTGYDLKEGIYTNVGADIAEPGAIVVGARFFGEVIRRLPDGIVTVSADEDNKVKVKCGRSEFNFMGIHAGDYPEMPGVDPVNNIVIPQNTLRGMIDQTIFAVSTNEVRPIYTGTLFEIEDHLLTLVSVDGYRLAKRCEEIEDGQLESCSFVVPGTALSDVQRICGDEGNVQISVGTKHISFVVGDTVVVTRRLEGEFLNYKKSIPDSFRYVIKVDRSEIMSVIDRVAVIVSEKNSSPVRMRFGDGVIDFLCMTPLGKSEDQCGCEGSGEDLEIGFNDRYLMDALKAAGQDELHLCLNTASSPSVIEAADGSKKFTYMILPVRLRAGD
ncbi:MAG: DNA polymerase III subunit beta [Oscillospiraceae bacterium]|nr:DNA polymerase III subunit beta [Oscillospiraceae bacterium]MBR3293830.1 DNA polymerase III subunit beta [Oscillospiraceae bacterium]